MCHWLNEQILSKMKVVSHSYDSSQEISLLDVQGCVLQVNCWRLRNPELALPTHIVPTPLTAAKSLLESNQLRMVRD
jgi:hypothetical protein